MILEALFNGDIYPAEQVVPTEPKFNQENKESSNIMVELKNQLKAEDYLLVEDMRTHLAAAQCVENEAFFQYGFAIGLMLMQEAQEMLNKHLSEQMM